MHPDRPPDPTIDPLLTVVEGPVLAVVDGPLAPDVAEEVRALAARAEAVDGVPPLGEQTFLRLADREAPARHVLVRDPSSGAAPGALVGYAQVDRGAEAELVVGPASRRQGRGSRLLAAAHAAAPGRRLHVWAHGDLPAARALAARAGMAPAHELWRMRVDLRTRPARTAPVPPGVAVRTAVPGRDDEAWVALNAAAFADHPDQGRWTVHDLRARQAEPWFDPAGLLLAERTAVVPPEPVGFVWTKVHPAGALAAEPVGELYVLGVHPSAQGTGLGRALTELGLRHLADRGLAAAVLWTSASNHRAVHTYTASGFVQDGVDVQYADRDADEDADQRGTVTAPGHRTPPRGATMGT